MKVAGLNLPLNLPKGSTRENNGPGLHSPRPTTRPTTEAAMSEPVEAYAQRRQPSQPMTTLAEHSEVRQLESDHVKDTCRLSSSARLMIQHTLVAESTLMEGFRSHPSRSIRSIAVSPMGDLVATGDRVGRLFLYSHTTTADPDGQSKERLECIMAKQIYTSVIDPLNNVEVTPSIAEIAFLPRMCATQHLLVTNEKVPKLYKFVEVADTPSVQRRAVDQLDVKAVGALTSPHNRTQVLKQVHHYAMDHENVIHSVSVSEDGTQFVTADPTSVRLWCVEHPQTSVEVMRCGNPESPDTEHVTNGAIFPNAPSLYFACTTSGSVRVVDMRGSLLWSDRQPMVLQNVVREDEGQFKDLTATLLSCTLSPCGNYVAGRDAMTAMVWDVRSGGGSCLARWDLHPHLRPQLDTLYQNELLLEYFDIRYAGLSTLLTGSFDNRLCVIRDAHSRSNGGTTSLTDDAVEHFVVPAVAATGQSCSLHPASADSPKKDSATLESGSRITSLAAPVCTDGVTNLYLSNGEALIHCLVK